MVMEPEPQVAGDTGLEMVDVERLHRSMSELRRASNLEGLIQLQEQAEAISAASRGRTRRKAGRIAREASWAVHELRREGGETTLEHARRVARSGRESQWLRKGAEAKLMERLTALLHLLLYDGGSAAANDVLRDSLATTDADGFLRIEFPEAVRAQSALLLDGFERSCRIFSEARRRGKTPHLEQTLKEAAVALVSAGAEVRGLSSDAVPLIAYGLFMEGLPPAVKSPEQVAKKIDDLVLDIADDVATIPVVSRPAFIHLFRLAVLLGEAQAYADHHSVMAIAAS